MIKPITPWKALDEKDERIPSDVIACWNHLILTKLKGRESRITQEAAVQALCIKMDVPRERIFEEGWLDIEAVFQKAGWIVRYEKQMIGDNFDSYFTFRAPTHKS